MLEVRGRLLVSGHDQNSPSSWFIGKILHDEMSPFRVGLSYCYFNSENLTVSQVQRGRKRFFPVWKIERFVWLGSCQIRQGQAWQKWKVFQFGFIYLNDIMIMTHDILSFTPVRMYQWLTGAFKTLWTLDLNFPGMFCSLTYIYCIKRLYGQEWYD